MESSRQSQLMEQDEFFMRRAIALSEKAAFIEKSGGAFGAVIVKDGRIIGEGYNQVIKHADPTWHAEMHAIREACQKIGSPHLRGALLYTSAEPCPMCLAAAYWAQIREIFFASRVADAKQYGNFQDDDLFAEFQKPSSERQMKSHELLRQEAVAVWKKFSLQPDRIHY